MSEIKTNKISSLASNNDITIDPDGTGDTIIASGNVGILTSSPAHNLDVTQTGSTSARVGATGSSGDNDGTLIINNGGSGDAMLRFDYEGNTDRARIGVSSSGQQLEFYTAGNNERMRIDSSGHILFGRGSVIDSGRAASGTLSIGGAASGTSECLMQFKHGSNTDSTQRNYILIYNDSGTIVGSITANSSSTAYNTSSDYRLKTAVTYDWDATTRLKQLKPARFEWIADGDDAVPVDGFLAHEAQAVVPESVTGTKDEVDDDGNAVMQGIDQSKLVPLLVKTILELEARITALESK